MKEFWTLVFWFRLCLTPSLAYDDEQASLTAERGDGCHLAQDGFHGRAAVNRLEWMSNRCGGPAEPGRRDRIHEFESVVVKPFDHFFDRMTGLVGIAILVHEPGLLLLAGAEAANDGIYVADIDESAQETPKVGGNPHVPVVQADDDVAPPFHQRSDAVEALSRGACVMNDVACVYEMERLGLEGRATEVYVIE